jgi:hypothetical protein
VQRQVDTETRPADERGQEFVVQKRQTALRSNVSLRAKRFLYHSI